MAEPKVEVVLPDWWYLPEDERQKLLEEMERTRQQTAEWIEERTQRTRRTPG